MTSALFFCAAMIYEKCDVDPTVGNILTSPEFSLSSDRKLSLRMASVTYSSYSTVSVYHKSMFGHIDTLIGTYSPPVFNTSAAAGHITYKTYTMCLPAGTYQLVFVASDSRNANESLAAITQILMTDSPCTYTSLAGMTHQYNINQSINQSINRYSLRYSCLPICPSRSATDWPIINPL